MSKEFPIKLGELRVAPTAHDVGLKGGDEGNGQSRSQSVDCVRMVHMVRHSLNFVGHKQRKEVAADLKNIYRAATRQEAERELDHFAEKWDEQYPTIAAAWRRNWERLCVFFAYPPEIRRVIYTTNAIESTNMGVRKVIKTRGSFPSDEAALKLVYLALRNITERWTMPVKEWRAALNRFAILFEDRMPVF